MTSDATADSDLRFTGERFLPNVRGAIWYEHWHRYAAVAPLATGKRVLDAACGEGYGSFLLAGSAAAVTGVDIAPEAVAHANASYALPNLRFSLGSVAQLPIPSASVDLVVSFETIEHLHEQEAMLAEFRRVLTPEGVLVISSPNRPVYSNDGTSVNEYHVRELDRAELATLLTPGFPQQSWYAQRVVAQSVLWAQAPTTTPAAFLTLAADRPESVAAPGPAMYFVVVCAAHGVALPTLPAVSLFDDGAASLWKDYARALARERDLAWDEVNARRVSEQRLAELVTNVNALASEREAGRVKSSRISSLEVELANTQRTAQSAIARLESALAEREAAVAHSQAALAREADAHAGTRAAHSEVAARLAYRESARGWLRFPLVAARRRMGERQ